MPGFGFGTILRAGAEAGLTALIGSAKNRGMLWSAAKAGGRWASQNWDKAALGAIGISGALGLARRDRSMLGSAGATAGYGLGGMGLGALIGSIDYAGGGALKGLLPGLRSASAFRGAIKGSLAGLGFGVLKAGLGSNKPRNPIRGLY